jgi:hypothetical protein
MILREKDITTEKARAAGKAGKEKANEERKRYSSGP